MKLNKIMKASMSLAAAMGCLALAAGSANAALITVAGGLSVTASSSLTGDYLPAKAIDGTGLTTNQHGTASRTGWLSGSGGTVTPGGADTTTANQWIQFDLGDVYNLSSVQVWNYNQSSYTVSGINQLDIYYSAAATAPDAVFNAAQWTSSVLDTTFSQAPGLTTYTGFDLATEIGSSLPTSGVRYVRFEVDSYYGGNGAFPDSVGISEIQFNGTAVPEPTTTGLLGFGGLALILRRRR